MRKALLLCVTMVVLTFSGLATARVVLDIPGGNFKLVGKGKNIHLGELNDINNQLEVARELYLKAGFNLPSGKMKVVVTERRRGASHYNPLSKKIKIVIRVDKKGRRKGGNATSEGMQFTAAHELFHAAQFATLGAGDSLALAAGWVWAYTHRSEPGNLAVARFFSVFEGMAESMAWMALPDLGAKVPSSLAHADFWYDPSRFDGLPSALPGCGVLADYPFDFIDPWFPPLSQSPCGDDSFKSLMSAAYSTVPAWLRFGQEIGGPPVTGNYRAARRAMAQLWGHMAAGPGIDFASRFDDFLSAHGSSRADIRDGMTLAAGVEQFHDLDDGGRYSVPLFRDIERRLDGDNELERLGDESDCLGTTPHRFCGYLSWRRLHPLSPPSATLGNTLKTSREAALIAPIADSRLVEFKWDGKFADPATPGVLPAFGGVSHQYKYPLSRNAAVPPVAVMAMELSDAGSDVSGVVVAGVRDSGQTPFPPQVTPMQGDGVVVPLNDFRLRDLSLLTFGVRAQSIGYRWLFVGPDTAQMQASGTAIALRPGRHRWASVEVEPSQGAEAKHVATLMVTPSHAPRDADKVLGFDDLWHDSPVYELVDRRQQASGGWQTGKASKDIWWHSFDTRRGAVNADRFDPDDARLRVDIAKVHPGKAGGGRYLATLVDEDLAAVPQADLMVRKLGVELIESADAPNAPCNRGAMVEVLVTNQGNLDARPFRVRVKAKVVGKQQEVVSAFARADAGLAQGHTLRLRIPLKPTRGKAIERILEGSVTLDSLNKVSEASERNNVVGLGSLVADCGKKAGFAGFQPDLEHLLSDPQAFAHLAERATQGDELARELTAWLSGTGGVLQIAGDPQAVLSLERVQTLRDAGLFEAEMQRKIAELGPDKLPPLDDDELNPSWVRALAAQRVPTPDPAKRGKLVSHRVRMSPAGLVLEDGETLRFAESDTDYGLIELKSGLGDGEFLFNGEETDYDTDDALMPVPPGSHTVTWVSDRDERTGQWRVSVAAGQRVMIGRANRVFGD